MPINSSRHKDLAGMRFGMLVATEFVGTEKWGHAVWLCRCDCGNTCTLSTPTMKKKGHCGCQTSIRTSKAAKTHSGSNDRLYRVFIGMIDRCEREGHVQYANYGGRGIRVCNEWRHDYQAFKDWAYANGYDESAPKGQCTIDRIDSDGDYSPTNCRFIDITEQQSNKRNNRLVTIDGKTKNVAQWCREFGLNPKTVSSRLYAGWEPIEALTIPVRHEFASKRKAVE